MRLQDIVNPDSPKITLRIQSRVVLKWMMGEITTGLSAIARRGSNRAHFRELIDYSRLISIEFVTGTFCSDNEDGRKPLRLLRR